MGKSTLVHFKFHYKYKFCEVCCEKLFQDLEFLVFFPFSLGFHFKAPIIALTCLKLHYHNRTHNLLSVVAEAQLLLYKHTPLLCNRRHKLWEVNYTQQDSYGQLCEAPHPVELLHGYVKSLPSASQIYNAENYTEDPAILKQKLQPH